MLRMTLSSSAIDSRPSLSVSYALNAIVTCSSTLVGCSITAIADANSAWLICPSPLTSKVLKIMSTSPSSSPIGPRPSRNSSRVRTPLPSRSSEAKRLSASAWTFALSGSMARPPVPRSDDGPLSDPGTATGAAIGRSFSIE